MQAVEATRQAQEAVENAIFALVNGVNNPLVRRMISRLLGLEVMTDDNLMRTLAGEVISDRSEKLAEINSPAPPCVGKANGNACAR